MLYDSLKILHIISAALLITSIFYSYWLWKRLHYTTQMALTQRIQNQTLMVIIPFAIITIVHIIYFAMQRYTYPVEPFMIILSAFSLYALFKKTGIKV